MSVHVEAKVNVEFFGQYGAERKSKFPKAKVSFLSGEVAVKKRVVEHSLLNAGLMHQLPHGATTAVTNAHSCKNFCVWKPSGYTFLWPYARRFLERSSAACCVLRSFV